MITAVSIKGGETYLSKHLSANDYYAEGEKVEGEWVGKGAEVLGLEGRVEAEPFEKLRQNQHPQTGKQLTTHKAGPTKFLSKNTGKVEKRHPVALHDITLNAPKAASVAAIIGGDDRIEKAWHQSVRTAVNEMEQFAAVRYRKGRFSNSNRLTITGNITGALFFHDASRLLDPQLHAHLVLANASQKDGQWKALQRRAMMEASLYVREFLYHDLARRLEQLGYEIEPASKGTHGFHIKGISEEIERTYSQRTLQREAFEARYKELFGHRASERRVEHFIKDSQRAATTRFKAEYKKAFGKNPGKAVIEGFVQDWREDKPIEISTPEVRALQRERLDQSGLDQVESTVRVARKRAGIDPQPVCDLKEAALKGLDHCLERTSVPRLGDALAAALRFGSQRPGDIDPRGLYQEMRNRQGAICDGYHISTEEVYQEELKIIQFTESSRRQFGPLGDIKGACMDLLDEGQKRALSQLVKTSNGVAVLIGDAGTGKTHTLKRFDEAYRHRHQRGLVALATNTQGATELAEIGYSEAKTVAAFLCTERLQREAEGQAIIVDEAGALSTKQMAQLVDIVGERQARLILVGDTKQHESVERGNALRSIVESGLIKPARLLDVRRQRREQHRKIARLLADGQALKALEQAEALDMVHEISDARDLFDKAVSHYADNLEAGRETLVVIPTWEDIEQFNEEARRELKSRGVIHGEELEIRGSGSLSWTEVERCHWQDYEPGYLLNFHRAVSGMKAGDSATVKSIQDNGVVVVRPDGTEVLVGRRQRNAFDVAKERPLKLAAGDALLFRANCKDIKVSNGDRLKVESVDPRSGKVTMSGGKVLPPHFTQLSHGHAVTSHKSQGASVQESLLVVGPRSLPASNLRQFYVSNTRFKEGHRLYVHDLKALKKAVAIRSERMLAREFVAELGKELGSLLKQREAAKAVQEPTGSQIVQAKLREERIRELTKDLAFCERQQGSNYRSLWKKLGVEQLPRVARNWFEKRRQRMSRRAADQRHVRRAWQMWQTFNRARRTISGPRHGR